MERLEVRRIRMADTKKAIVEFSWLIALQKSFMKTLIPTLVALGTLLVANPGLLGSVLGKWGTLTGLDAALFLVNLILNWAKNKDLGK